ncbi:hypothetical protein GCG54_00011908 [Colletotrichum gloeosporioides]|uniref:Uncharacterized protein n=1 Tax=Colletotrichum gloeosporioides TaxID=474922 RepID=A0A8H4C5K4_COLGL|nr:uncharacterized protein GCG54_00011908 [Colletotrichum gloeosporioides]KAF3797816.1 hypothetical protein GCG54_00011908 [Colletotrichum gloeosporioides]
MAPKPRTAQPSSPDTNPRHTKPEYLFYKSMRDGIPSFDVLVMSRRSLHKRSAMQQISIGNIVPSTTEGFYIHNFDGVTLELKSLARVTFRTRDLVISEARACYAPKTCGFLAYRSEDGLQILKLCLSGDKLRPHRAANNDFGLCSRKWTKHVKTLAQLLGVNMRTLYDGHGRQAREEDRGNWAAAHCEKRLTAFAVHAFLQYYKIPRSQVTLQTLAELKNCLERESRTPLELELHVSRGPCGMPKRPGTCVKFVERLGRACGIRFDIVFFEDGSNLIVDESVPRIRRHTKKHRSDRTIGRADVYNSEEEDFLVEYSDNLADVSPDDGCGMMMDGNQEATQVADLEIIDLDSEIISPPGKDSEGKLVSTQGMVSHESRGREKRARASQHLHEARERTPKASAAKRLGSRGDVHQTGRKVKIAEKSPSPVQMNEIGCRQFTFCWNRGFCLCSSPLGSQPKDPSSWMQELENP